MFNTFYTLNDFYMIIYQAFLVKNLSLFYITFVLNLKVQSNISIVYIIQRFLKIYIKHSYFEPKITFNDSGYH